MTYQPIIHDIDIIRIKNGQTIPMKDPIIDEDIFAIYINGKKTFEMIASMIHPLELTAGFLFTQGIVAAKEEIVDMTVSETQKSCHVRLRPTAIEQLTNFKRQRQVRGSSGGMLLQGNDLQTARISSPDITLTPEQIMNLISSHWKHSQLFHKTGAVHSAGLCRPDAILSYFEDIGRHNALDKLAGAVLLEDIDTTDKVATLSCRMSLEIIGKIIKTGIPVVISNAAPTLSAVKLAQKAGLTIIGFARENRFNIYTHKNRILYPGA